MISPNVGSTCLVHSRTYLVPASTATRQSVVIVAYDGFKFI